MFWIIIIAIVLLVSSYSVELVAKPLTAWIPYWKWQTNPAWIAQAVKLLIYIIVYAVVILCAFCLGIVMLAFLSTLKK